MLLLSKSIKCEAEYEQYRNRTYLSLNDKFFYREPPLPFGAPALIISDANY